MTTTADNQEQVRVTLPDGSVRELPAGSTVRDLAQSIGAGLAKAALAGKIDGQLVDLFRPIEGDARVEIVTDRSPEALELLRHSAAHVLATAVRRVRPEAKIGFGPAIEDGFYYDFEVERPFTPDELERIEREMAEVAKADDPFERRVVSVEEARGLFADDPLKLERLEEFGGDETITVYRNGPFLDLCRGPHVPTTGRLKHFKLPQRGRRVLARRLATARCCSASTAPRGRRKEALEQYLHRIEEARKRDHRKLGRELDLFQFHPVSPGAAFWTPRGTTIYNALMDFMRERHADDFPEIKTPLLYNKTLWEQSGHWGKYRENMFLVLDTETGEHDMSLKPMNCPSHHLYYALEEALVPRAAAALRHLRRAAPQRALRRPRRPHAGAAVPQDDCHIYLREDQIAAEVRFLTDFILGYYETFGLTATAQVRHAPRGADRDDEMWDRAEAALRSALEATGLPYEMKPGDGAFYGPKIDFDVTDSHRPRLAARHHPARLRRPRALRPHLRGRGQRRAPARWSSTAPI